MVCSAAIIAAAMVSFPRQSIWTSPPVHAPASVTANAIGESTHEAWPYYPATCLRRDGGEMRLVRVISLDQS